VISAVKTATGFLTAPPHAGKSFTRASELRQLLKI